MLKVQGPACEDNSPGEKHTEETVAGADSQARCREDGETGRHMTQPSAFPRREAASSRGHVGGDSGLQVEASAGG